MARELISDNYLYFSLGSKDHAQAIIRRLLVVAVAFSILIGLSLSSDGKDDEQLNVSNVSNTANDSACPYSREQRVAEEDDRHPLYLVLMAPYPAEEGKDNPSWVAGHVVAPAVQLALDEINNRSDILEDYKLVMIENNTACRRGYEIWEAMLDIFLNGKQIVGIVGPGCSDPALELAEQIRQPGYSLVAITPSATSPQLESPKYENTFATISSSNAYVNVYKELMNYNDWKAVSVLYYETRGYFVDTFQKFSEVVNSDWIVFQSPVFNGEHEKFFPLKDILDLDRGRVILSFADTSTAKIMMCLAYNYSMIYPTYQWVFHDRTSAQLVKEEDFIYEGVSYYCSKQEMAKAINGTLLANYAIVPEDQEIISPTGQNFSQFRDSYYDVLCDFNSSTDSDPVEYGNTNYDAAWAFALALNSTSARINLASYKYGQPNITKEIRDDLYKVHFQGASGPILFHNETRSTTTNIDVFQVYSDDPNNIQEVKVAHFNGSIIPTDKSAFYIKDTFANVPVYIHRALSVTTILVAVALLSFAGILHIASTVWYNYRSIKATSPNISHLIFSGCYLFGISIIIYSVQQTSNFGEVVYSVMCNAFKWCLIMGYTLIFGTVLAKVWRVYRLFKHFRNKSPGILVSDNALIVFIVLLLIVDCCLCTIWDVTDPFLKSSSVEQRLQIDKIPSLLVRSRCSCKHFNLWVGAVSAYKGTIALLLVVFSILNRKIRRRDFQHTKKINILIYSLTMMGGVLFPTFFLLQDQNIHISFVILCSMLSIAILMSCLVLFLAPVGQVIKIKMGLSEDAQFVHEFTRKLSIASVLSVRSIISEGDSG